MVMSRSGSIDSSVSSCAMTSLAEASSICTPRKMMRSSKSLLYGFISLHAVRGALDEGRENVAAVDVSRPDQLTSRLCPFRRRRPARAPAARCARPGR